MREWQSLPQVLHVYAVCWTLLIRSFLRVRLLVAACVSFSSPVLRCLVTAPLHCDRSAARFSQVSVSIPTAFMSRFKASRYRSCGRPLRLLPVASSPYSKSLGMRPSGMRWTWPSQRSLRCLSKVDMLGRPARDKTSVFGTLSCHEIPRMRRRLLMWKVFRRFSCLAYIVHVSLPYSSVLMTQANLQRNLQKITENASSGAQETEERKTKKKNARVQDHRGLRIFVYYETLLNFFSGLQRTNRNDGGFNYKLWSVIIFSRLERKSSM